MLKGWFFINEYKELERWKDIEGFDGAYQVSTWGNVRSVDRYVSAKNGSKRFSRGKMLKPTLRSGYYSVNLSKDGVFKFYNIHLLVARAFIPKPKSDEGLVLNHIDEDPLNNYVENLEWITHKANLNHGTAILRKSKMIEGLDRDGNIVVQFNKMIDADAAGYNRRVISRIINGKRTNNEFKGLYWRQVDREEQLDRIKDIFLAQDTTWKTIK